MTHGRLGVLLLLLLFATFANAPADVRICDKDGNCYDFPDVPACKDWKLAAGSTCTDIVAGAVPPHKLEDGKLSIEYGSGGVITATKFDLQGKLVKSVNLLDLSEMLRSNYLGIGVGIAETTVAPSPSDKAGGVTAGHTVVQIQVLGIDRATYVPLQPRRWSFEIADSNNLTHTGGELTGATACPAGTYPPKCYPCLGCEPCKDGSGQYCDTTGKAIAVSKVAVQPGLAPTDGALAGTTACPAGTYPPKCYPCLGCEPCKDGSGQYCDTTGKTIAVSKVAVQPGLVDKTQVTTEDVAGLHRVIITTARGNKVFVNLPSDMNEGDTFSGTVFTEAAGKTDAEQAESLLELKEETIEIAGQKIPATSGKFQIALQKLNDPTVEKKKPCCVLIFRGVMIPVFCIPPLPINSLSAAPLPTYGQSGLPIEVTGHFDGVFSVTDYVKIGGKEMMLLAESPRGMTVFNTSPVIGQTEIEVREQAAVQKGRFRNVTIRMSAQKYVLRKGERTKMTVVVAGLDNLEEDVPLRLQNHTTSLLTIDGGDVQLLTIHPKDVKPGGIYETERMLTGIQVGVWVIGGIVTWKRY